MADAEKKIENERDSLVTCILVNEMRAKKKNDERTSAKARAVEARNSARS